MLAAFIRLLWLSKELEQNLVMYCSQVEKKIETDLVDINKCGTCLFC